MNFNSLQYLIFLPIVILIYYLLPHKVRWVWLLAASYYFYMNWNVWLIFLIVTTTLVSYLAALLMEKTSNIKLKKTLLIITLIVCLGSLGFFKYFNFMYGNIIDFLNIFKLNIERHSFDIILPIGISFYTFQTLSYVIDVYKGKYKAEKHLGYYALFVSFFPQLVAGPIERPDILIPQLKEEHKFSFENFVCGCRILLVGFVYKCVVADVLGIYVNKVFDNLANADAIAVIIAGVLFCFEMYGDFNGYSEIAVGSARIMGIKLSRNFNKPYLSTSYTEFFRRWHITLNTWFTDYLYIPLGGNRKGKLRQIINTWIVFLLCGLWHGANWTYVIWGGYAALMITFEILFMKQILNFFKEKKINIDAKPILYLRRVVLFFFFSISALFFRSASVAEIGVVLTKLVHFTSLKETWAFFDITILDVIKIIVVIILMDQIHKLGEINRGEPGTRKVKIKTDDDAEKIKALKPINYARIPVYVITIILIAICWICLLSTGDASDFAYFQF